MSSKLPAAESAIRALLEQPGGEPGETFVLNAALCALAGDLRGVEQNLAARTVFTPEAVEAIKAGTVDY